MSTEAELQDARAALTEVERSLADADARLDAARLGGGREEYDAATRDHEWTKITVERARERHDAAAEAHAAHLRSIASAELAEIQLKQSGLLVDLWGALDEGARQYERMVDVVKRLYWIESRHAELQRAAVRKADAAGVELREARPLTIPVLRHALGMVLTSRWQEPALPSPIPPTIEVERATSTFINEPALPGQRRIRLRELNDAWQVTFGGEIADFFSLRPEPHWSSASAGYVARHQQAAQLLETIKGIHLESGESGNPQ